MLVAMETIADFGTVAYFGVQTFAVGIYTSWFTMADIARRPHSWRSAFWLLHFFSRYLNGRPVVRPAMQAGGATLQCNVSR